VPELNRLYVGMAGRGKRKAGKLDVPEAGFNVEVRIYQAQL
jgi:hypothetical protein